METETGIKPATQVEDSWIVRMKSEEGKQNVGFSSRPLVLCGLAVRQAATGDMRSMGFFDAWNRDAALVLANSQFSLDEHVCAFDDPI